MPEGVPVDVKHLSDFQRLFIEPLDKIIVAYNTPFLIRKDKVIFT